MKTYPVVDIFVVISNHEVGTVCHDMSLNWTPLRTKIGKAACCQALMHLWTKTPCFSIQSSVEFANFFLIFWPLFLGFFFQKRHRIWVLIIETSRLSITVCINLKRTTTSMFFQSLFRMCKVVQAMRGRAGVEVSALQSECEIFGFFILLLWSTN